MPKPRPALFRRRHFRDEIILLCVRWYLRYSLSYRDLEEMMAERGLRVDLSTIARWFYATPGSERAAHAPARPFVESRRNICVCVTGHGPIYIELWIPRAILSIFCCLQSVTQLLPSFFCSWLCAA